MGEAPQLRSLQKLRHSWVMPGNPPRGDDEHCGWCGRPETDQVHDVHLGATYDRRWKTPRLLVVMALVLYAGALAWYLPGRSCLLALPALGAAVALWIHVERTP